MNHSDAIEAVSVVKTYPGGRRANDGLSLNVRTGEVVGLIGPNGSGKTTFLRQLLGLLKPDEGAIWVLGEDVRDRPWSVKGKVAYAPQLPLSFPALTAEEALGYVLSLCGVSTGKRSERVDEALDLVGLSGSRRVLGYQLSPGMTKQLLLAMAFCQDASILVLDEPTSMVDVLTKSRIWHRLREVHRTVLMASHDLGEIRELCDRAYLIANGRVLSEGQPQAISASLALPVDVEFLTSDEAAAVNMLREKNIPCSQSGALFSCAFPDLGTCLATLAELSTRLSFDYLRLEGPSFEKAVVHILEGERT